MAQRQVGAAGEHGVDVEVVAGFGAGLAGGQFQVLLGVAEVSIWKRSVWMWHILSGARSGSVAKWVTGRVSAGLALASKTKTARSRHWKGL